MEINKSQYHIRECLKSFYALAYCVKDDFYKHKIINYTDKLFNSAFLFETKGITGPIISDLESLEMLLSVLEYALKLDKVLILGIRKNLLLLKKTILIQNNIKTPSKDKLTDKITKKNVILVNKNFVAPKRKFNELQGKIIEILNNKGELNTTELCNVLHGISPRTLRR